MAENLLNIIQQLSRLVDANWHLKIQMEECSNLIGKSMFQLHDYIPRQSSLKLSKGLCLIFSNCDSHAFVSIVIVMTYKEL